MRFSLSLLLFLFIMLSAPKTFAQHYYYMPNSIQMPAFKQRHDAGIGVGWSRGSASKALELHASYSPVKQVAVSAAYMNSGEKGVLENLQEGLHYRFYEIGAGVYEPLPRGTASLMVGIGHGDMYNFFQGDESVDLNLQRLFIQPAILYRDAFFQGGLSLRLSRIKFTSGRVAIAIPPSELNAIETIEQKSPFFLPEIGIIGGMRLAPFLLSVNVTGIFPRTDDLNFVRLNSSILLSVELGKLFRKKN